MAIGRFAPADELAIVLLELDYLASTGRRDSAVITYTSEELATLPHSDSGTKESLHLVLTMCASKNVWNTNNHSMERCVPRNA